MSFRKKGFLSRTIRTQRRKLRQAHADWLKLAEKLNRIGQEVVLTERALDSEHGYSDYRVVALLYFTRALSALQAAILLAERGMVVEANTITREMIETTTMLAGLHRKKQDFVKELASADYAERSAAGNWYLQTPSVTEHVTEENKEKLQKFLDDLENAEFPIRKLFIANVSQKTGLSELYAIYRHLSHHYGHASMTAVSKFAVTEPATGNRAIFWSPEYGRNFVGESLGFLCSTFFGALLAVDEIWPLPGVRERISEAFDIYRRLADKSNPVHEPTDLTPLRPNK